MLEIDSLMVIKMLTINMICLFLLSTLVLDCRELLTCSWWVTPQHVYREANTYRGRSQAESLINYENCPSFVYQPFIWDSKSVTTTRHIFSIQNVYFV